MKKLLETVGGIAAATLAMWSSGCGEPPFICTAEHTGGWFNPGVESACGAAVAHAATDTAELIPTQAEVDRYHERVQRVIAAEPALAGSLLPRDASGLMRTSMFTDNPLVVAAWEGLRDEASPPLTGDPVFDQVMGELRPIVLDSRPTVFGAERSFGLLGTRVFNPVVLDERLGPTMSWLPGVHDESVQSTGATWRWIGASGTGADDAQAEIDIVVGWGDCFVGCIFKHEFLAIVPPVGDATVYDLGGAPLPDGFELSPNTLPPP